MFTREQEDETPVKSVAIDAIDHDDEALDQELADIWYRELGSGDA